MVDLANDVRQRAVATVRTAHTGRVHAVLY